MSDNKRGQGVSTESERSPKGLRGLLYHNSFVLALSFLVALVAWFVVASENTDSNRLIADVPIEVQFSAAAEGEGLRVFDMTYDSADLEVSGSSLITSRLKPEDFYVSVTLDPVSTKLTGNTVQRITVPVEAVKNSSISDYNIVSVNPDEVTLVYDRYREITLQLDTSEVNYSVKSGFFADAVVLSEPSVTISGPASSVGKISRAVVSASYGTALQSDTTFPGEVVLYDQDNRAIDLSEAASSLYLEVSVAQVEVTVPVLATKIVPLETTNLLHRPANFPDNRIVLSPETITLAGSQEALDQITSIQLDTPIDFAQLNVNLSNQFTVDIPLPVGVRNIAGESAATQATVTINLGGYSQASLSVPAENIQIINRPAGMDVTLDSQGLEVSVMGTQAQMMRLTGESLAVQVDLASFSGQTGRLTVPATVSIAGTSADSCWVLGTYSVTLTIEEPTAEPAVRTLSPGEGASPQE